MEIGRIHLKIDQWNEVPKVVTPAEAVILTRAFEPLCNGKPVSKLKILEDKDITNETEITRLRENYPKLRVTLSGENKPVKVVDVCYPGESPKLPQTFAEVAKTLGPGYNYQGPPPVMDEAQSASNALQQELQEAEATPTPA